MTLPIRLALLISGGGTTMEQILRACRNEVLTGLVEPRLVIASRDNIGGIQRAINAGFSPHNILICGRRDFKSDEELGANLLVLLDGYKVDLVGQYGWLCKTPANVVARYRDRIINQHPGPLDTGFPDFGGDDMYGRRVHYTVLEYYKYLVGIGEKQWPQYTEASAHWATEEYDKGAIIGQIPVQIYPDDTVDSLQQRVLPFEHQLQVDVLLKIATETIQVFKRENRLIEPWREVLLNRLKAEAKAAYPNG